MLKIRLTRRGKKSKAFFRLVVAEHTAPIKGRFVETLGFLNPHTKERVFKEDRIKYWLERGARPSDSAHNLLVTAGIVKGSKKAIKMKKKEETVEKKPEEKTEETKPEQEKTEEKPEKPAEESAREEKKEEKKADEKQ